MNSHSGLTLGTVSFEQDGFAYSLPGAPRIENAIVMRPFTRWAANAQTRESYSANDAYLSKTGETILAEEKIVNCGIFSRQKGAEQTNRIEGFVQRKVYKL